PRVVSREQFNLRHMRREDVGQEVDILVADLSFISLTLVLPAVLQVLRPGGQALVLIKPQFELEREDVGKGGIVRDPALHQKAVARIHNWVALHPDFEWRSILESPIKGGDGNVEYLAWIGKR
ncbi:MAG: SAM-dependent methyltransferase, partial [Verrucomicrobiota bacterium]